MTTSSPFRSTRNGIIASILCAMSFGATAPAATAASSADQPGLPRITVRFADLDLARRGDAMRLYRRIQAAANAVCWRLDDNDLSSRLRMQSCVQKAVADAVGRIDRPVLIAIYNAHHRPPLPTTAATAHP